MTRKAKSITRRAYLRTTTAVTLGIMLGNTGRTFAAGADELVMPFSLDVELGLPMMVAVAKGYAKKHGIEVTNFAVAPGSQVRANLIGKLYDFAALDWSHVPIARLAGSPLQAVLAITERSNQTLLVRNGLKGEVHKVEDLKGKLVGCSAPGSSSWTNAKLTLDKVGLQPDRDYNLIIIGGDTGVVVTALQTGRVDAFSTWEPITTLSLTKDVAFPLVKAWDLEAQKRFYGSEWIAALSLISREDVIKTKPDLVKRMVATHIEALDFIHKNTPEAIVDAVLSNPKSAESFSNLGRDVFVSIVEKAKPAFGSGCISKLGFESQMKRMVDYKVVPRSINFEEYANTTFAGSCA